MEELTASACMGNNSYLKSYRVRCSTLVQGVGYNKTCEGRLLR